MPEEYRHDPEYLAWLIAKYAKESEPPKRWLHLRRLWNALKGLVKRHG